MAIVYEKAFVTIVAVSSSNPRESFLKFGDSCAGGQSVLIRNDESSASALIMARREFRAGIHRKVLALDPLRRRGYSRSLQLSRRAIAYTSDEIQWHCRRTTKCQCGERPSQNSVKDMLRLPQDDMSQLWHDLVRRYSQISLTYPEDKLVALSGLASRIGSNLNSVCVAGLWKSHLVHDLVWYRCLAPCITGNTVFPLVSGIVLLLGINLMASLPFTSSVSLPPVSSQSEKHSVLPKAQTVSVK